MFFRFSGGEGLGGGERFGEVIVTNNGRVVFW